MLTQAVLDLILLEFGTGGCGFDEAGAIDAGDIILGDQTEYKRVGRVGGAGGDVDTLGRGIQTRASMD